MRQSDSFYCHLLHECQSDDLQRRLEALEDLRRHGYVDLVEPQFLLNLLNSTSDGQEQAALLYLMTQIHKSLPTDALLAILADSETSTALAALMAVVGILAISLFLTVVFTWQVDLHKSGYRASKIAVVSLVGGDIH